MNLHIADQITSTEIIGKTTIMLTQSALDSMQPCTWGNLLQVSVMIPPESEYYSQTESVSEDRGYATLEQFARELAKSAVPRQPYIYHPMLAALDGAPETGWHIRIAFGVPFAGNVTDEYDLWKMLALVWGDLKARYWVEDISEMAVLGLMGRLQLLDMSTNTPGYWSASVPVPNFVSQRESEFHRHLIDKIKQAEKLTGDDLGGVRNLIQDLTGAEVARLLIDNTGLRETPNGFMALAERNLHHLTIEQAIIDFEDSGLFDREAIDAAKARLAIFAAERNQK